jgi:general secretion pathway protein F/type IV pilus assembly protein PilC
VRRRNLAVMYGQLSDLLRSGVPLLRSLEILERQSVQPALAEVLHAVREQVADGKTLADAMREHPRAFDDLTVSMVRAGQEGGFLEDVLRRVAQFADHQEDLKGRVYGAMAYPVFLMVVGFIIVSVLIVFFVPRFEPMFERLARRGQLPAVTTSLLATSSFLQRQGVFVLAAAFLGGWAARSYLRTDRGRMLADRAKLRLPGAGPIFRSLAIARFCRILGTMLQNGVPILNSLRIAKDSAGNRVLSESISEAAENISSGQSLAAPLRACGHFPKDVVEMIAVGEESNNLEEVLLGIAESTERRTTRRLDLLVRLLEPVMLLVMAGITLFVVSALLLPVFRMSSALR